MLNRSLFSGTGNDPYMWAECDSDCLAKDSRGLPLAYDLVVAIGPAGTIVMQTLVFNDGGNHAKYLADGVVVFEQEGLE